MPVVYPLTAAKRHTIHEALYELMADFERPWRMLMHLWTQYWGEHPTDYQEQVGYDAEFIGDMILTITNVLGDALASYHLMTGGEFEGDRGPCNAYLEEAQRVEKSRRIDECIDAVRQMICQSHASHSLSTSERDAFLERLHGGIMTKRDEDIMPVLEEFTKEVKDSIDRKTE